MKNAKEVFEQGLSYLGENPTQHDYDNAVACIKESAELGYAEAQNTLGLIFFIGEWLPQDFDKAKEWLLKAEEQENIEATHNLGTVYYTEQKLEKAVAQWQKAAQQGYADAQYCLGISYERGEGVKADNNRALEWLEKAAEQGHEEALFNYNELLVKTPNNKRKPIYNDSDIITKVRKALESPATLYAQDFTNYRGVINGVRYTEIAAQELIKNISTLCAIPTIRREKSYKVEGHAELAKREQPKDSKRNEEWLAIGMYGKSYKHIGKIIDFQTPLKSVASDIAGKIDLLSYNEEENVAYILELKKPDSKETLLRCVLEAYTYWKTVDKEKLLCSFGIKGAELRKAVLLYNNCDEYEQFLETKEGNFDVSDEILASDSCLAYKDFHNEECDEVFELMTEHLFVDLFVLNKKGDQIIEDWVC
ncbi:MAG: sel1 repeat family protein [Defluviitaleaceae bacterium]|nr:sel1 repeat family protein [Defluviitaleaceae bacterium]MCL2274237.1 sel1 repeat family protein [Defluviitaleaceae bacterium]